MRLNYKRLGDYIQPINQRNVNLEVETLLGVSIRKVLMPSIANTIGTDMSRYKIIKKNQFAYGPVTSRNGDKISIALLEEHEKALVSQAYTVFEIIDDEALNAEYLMMWFRRPEFDRYARFKSHGSARETFDWEELKDTELPIPCLEKQLEIVKEYNTIVNRIKLNETLNQKLEDTAQALYKHWFVDFEFPNAEGKPYKSSGGKMFYNEELDLEIPESWEDGLLEDIIEIFDSQRIPLSGSERINMEKLFPYYGAASLMDYVDSYLFDGTYILLGEDGTVVNINGTPVLQYVKGKFWVNNHAHILKAKNGFDENSLYILLANVNITDIITGGVQAKINQTNLKAIKILVPNRNILKLFNLKLSPIFSYKMNLNDSSLYLEKLRSILLSKMSKVETKTAVV
jgi:type I restriction enzyme S subunit